MSEYERIKRAGELAIAQAETKRLEASLANLTDKGAKDFQKGMGSMEKVSKIGGFMAFGSMLMNLISSSPAVEIFSAFLKVFTSKIWAEIDWAKFIAILQLFTPLINAAAEAIGEKLNVELEEAAVNAERLAYLMGLLNVELGPTNDAIQGFYDSLGPLGVILQEIIKFMGDSIGTISLLGSNIKETDVKMQAFNIRFGNFKNMIETFSFPSLGGGIGGGIGGGGGDIDLDPWDLF